MNDRNRGGPAPVAPGPAQGFQHIEADAVCERCGTVNDDGSLMCKACGQNLREQRQQRLAGVKTTVVPRERISRSRLVTGILSAVGLLVVVIAALSIDNIEAGLVSVMSEEPGAVAGGSLWSGTLAPIFEELRTDLTDYPTSRADMQSALDNPATETSYNGRYILLEPGALQAERVIGEAALQRRGNRVYFVAMVRRPAMEIRGYAVFEEMDADESGGTVERPVVRNTASYVAADGQELRGYGLSEPLDNGGHQVLAVSTSTSPDEADQQVELFAYRIR
jgi:hypothetical protein